MATRKGCRWGLTTLALLALLCGCDSRDARQEPVSAAGQLVSKEGRFAFIRITGQKGTNIDADIYTVAVDRKGEKRLTKTPRTFDGTPVWSPSGERLAFVSDRDGGDWEIFVMDPDGTGQRQLTDSPQDEAFLDWSPDGERIAFSTDPTGEPEVWVMDTDGSGRERLADGAFPSWSPDGRRIAFTDYVGESPYLAVMNADGSGLTRLTHDPADDVTPAWRP